MDKLTKAINDNKKAINAIKDSNLPDKEKLIKHKMLKHAMLKDKQAQEKINKWLGK